MVFCWKRPLPSFVRHHGKKSSFILFLREEIFVVLCTWLAFSGFHLAIYCEYPHTYRIAGLFDTSNPSRSDSSAFLTNGIFVCVGT